MIADYTGPKNRKHRQFRRTVRKAMNLALLTACAFVLGMSIATLIINLP